MRWSVSRPCCAGGATPDTLVPPAEFIGVAEESGLIVEIGAWVVSRATADIARWIADGLQAMPVAVNVSARQCVNRNIVEVVRSALREIRAFRRHC